MALVAKWLPTADPEDPEVLGAAFFLEEEYWKRMTVAVQNAIARAIK